MTGEFSLATASAADFAPLVGSDFVMVLEEGRAVALRLTLHGVRESDGRGAGRAPFSLDFGGPREHPLAQAAYLLHHDALGELTLFLVPVGLSANGYEYEAVFN